MLKGNTNHFSFWGKTMKRNETTNQSRRSSKGRYNLLPASLKVTSGLLVSTASGNFRQDQLLQETSAIHHFANVAAYEPKQKISTKLRASSGHDLVAISLLLTLFAVPWPMGCNLMAHAPLNWILHTASLAMVIRLWSSKLTTSPIFTILGMLTGLFNALILYATAGWLIALPVLTVVTGYWLISKKLSARRS